MKLWIDDVKPAPEGYVWCKSVYMAKSVIIWYSYRENEIIELIDIDHDAGDYACCGGHYIEILKWLEKTGRNYPIHIHSDNEFNKVMMRAIIERNGWKEIE